MAYTTIKKPSDYFNTKLYTGTGASNSQTVGFQPDFCWFKGRNLAYHHYLFDSVRGANKPIYSSLTTAETTQTDTLMSFDSNGFTLGTDTNNGEMNSSGNTFASWNWLANGTGSANTDGSISSTVSANTTSGFSIVSWSGNSTAGATIGHGLGLAPKMIIVKDRDGADSWAVYHNSLAITEYLILNSASAALTDNEVIFYDTDPTSSVFTVGAHNTVNQSGHNYIAYCFAEKQGFSKIGSYTGNGNADGPFIYTGFKPSFVIIKNTDAAESWSMFDGKRPDSNQTNGLYQLQPNTSGAEYQGAPLIDFLSNGFKLRTATNSLNVTQNYIYMAFAEEPLVGDNPATAR